MCYYIYKYIVVMLIVVMIVVVLVSTVIIICYDMSLVLSRRVTPEAFASERQAARMADMDL